MHYKVLITTSGTGSRLKHETKDFNKSLIDIAGKPAIEYILDVYPSYIPLVITIGYKAEQVRNFFVTKYPNRSIEFVEVSPYEGSGSSLGYSMIQARPRLQCPFIFHACDTLIEGQIPEPIHNWIAGFRSHDTVQYRTLHIDNNKVTDIYDKGVGNSDIIHLGLVGIHDYMLFWQTLEEAHDNNRNDESLNDTSALVSMIKKKSPFDFVNIDRWLDTGNSHALALTRQFYLNQI